VPRQPNFEGFE